jgi:uncharacterized protein YjiS (DUF1127 family)
MIMLLSWLLARIERELDVRRTVRRLNQLSDHHLRDIGLVRRMVESAARGQSRPDDLA